MQETTFRGGKDRSVEGLAWTQEPDEGEDDDEEEDEDARGKARRPGRFRLFSIGYSSTVTEWDLASGLPLRHSSGNHDEVWCLAAQPRRRGPRSGKELPLRRGGAREVEGFASQNLVAGCADGTLAILSTADDDLRFQRFLHRPTTKKARVLSVAFQSRDVVVAGFADSAIRVYDVRSGSLVRTISLGVGPPGGRREILVWSVKCLPDGGIVSGDSSGEVRFYDGKSYAQLQRMSGHEADVLDLAVGEDGRTVFSGGMDRRTVVYRLGGGRNARWAKISGRRYHEHDVKAMAVHEGKGMSVVVSGGNDEPIALQGYWLIPNRSRHQSGHNPIAGAWKGE